MLNLQACRSKIERAKKHIRDLDLARVAFLGTNPYVGIPKFHPEENQTVFVLESIPGVPNEIAAILGDAIHNLRTALDYLASELVRSAGNEPKGVYFPIADTAEKYEAESGGKTKGMPKEAKEIIDRLRPYGGGNYFLWALHKLDIIDKHRLLPAVGMKIGGWQISLSLTPTEYNFSFPSVLENGDVIGWIPGDHVADKQMSISADITFGEPEVFKGRPMMQALADLIDFVEAIVFQFETHYSPPSHL